NGTTAPPREPAGLDRQAADPESAARAPATESATAPATESAQNPAPMHTAQNPAPPPGDAKKPFGEPPPQRVTSSHAKQNPTSERTATNEGTAAPGGEAPVADGNRNQPTATQAADPKAAPTSTDMAAPRRGADHRRAHRDAWRREYTERSQPQNPT